MVLARPRTTPDRLRTGRLSFFVAGPPVNGNGIGDAADLLQVVRPYSAEEWAEPLFKKKSGACSEPVLGLLGIPANRSRRGLPLKPR